MCKVPLLSSSGEPAAATIEKDEKAPLKSASKFTADQQTIIRAGEVWRSHISPAILVFVLVLPMLIYQKECKFRLLNHTYIKRIFIHTILHALSLLFVIRLLYLLS